MGRKKKQEQIPGTEREEIEELTDAAEVLRKAKQERAAVTKQISEAQAHLNGVVDRCIEEGEIELPDKAVHVKTVVYTYDDEDGKSQDVTYSTKSSSGVTGHKGGGEEEGNDEGEGGEEDPGF